jgi:hypothetical protein
VYHETLGDAAVVTVDESGSELAGLESSATTMDKELKVQASNENSLGFFSDDAGVQLNADMSHHF